MNENLNFAEPIESKIATTTEWIKNISNNQEVKEISVDTLKNSLEHFGAKFEGLSDEARESLRGYSEKEKGAGVRAVWGDEIVNNYKLWTKDYIANYEDDLNNKKLPELKPSGRKNSGMVQFLFELTSFASGEMSFDDFKKYTEARSTNGKLWSENRSNERVKIKVATAEEPILLSSFPPEFPIKAFGWLSSKL